MAWPLTAALSSGHQRHQGVGTATAIDPVTAEQAGAYFANTMRNAAWLALSDPDQVIALAEAQSWLGTMCPNPDEAGCCGDFAGAWIAAVSELALALHNNPQAVISTGVAPTLAVKRNKLGDLEQEFFGGPGEATAVRFGPRASPVLRAFPWLYDIIGCWLTTGTGSAVISRVRS